MQCALCKCGNWAGIGNSRIKKDIRHMEEYESCMKEDGWHMEEDKSCMEEHGRNMKEDGRNMMEGGGQMTVEQIKGMVIGQD